MEACTCLDLPEGEERALNGSYHSELFCRGGNNKHGKPRVDRQMRTPDCPCAAARSASASCAGVMAALPGSPACAIQASPIGSAPVVGTCAHAPVGVSHP